MYKEQLMSLIENEGFTRSKIARHLVCRQEEVDKFLDEREASKNFLFRVRKFLAKEEALDPAVKSIRYLRRQQGWSRGELADYADLAAVTVAKLEKGERDPQLSTIRQILAVFVEDMDVDLRSFFSFDVNGLLKIEK